MLYELVLSLTSIPLYIACWFYFIRVSSAKVPQTSLPLLGIVIPPLGSLVGLYYLTMGPTKRRLFKQRREFLTESSDKEIAQYIDENSTSSVVASNSSWYKEKWHKLSNDEKTEWIKSKRSKLIEYLPQSENAHEFVTTLSKLEW